MAFSMGWRGTTWMGVIVERRVAGEKDCQLLTVNGASSQRSGAWSKVRKGRLYISTSHTSTMYFINNAMLGSDVLVAGSGRRVFESKGMRRRLHRRQCGCYCTYYRPSNIFECCCCLLVGAREQSQWLEDD
jgi:hypothetical protein